MPNLYQLSTLSALLLGDFEPSLSIGELKRHGTLGIGTFEGLGGELIMLDGVVWNGTHSGEAVPAADIEKTPFACVIDWQPTASAVKLPAVGSLDNLRTVLDEAAKGAENRVLAVRLQVFHADVTFRSFAPAPKPWKPMKDMLFSQKITAERNIQAEIIGFRFPGYLESINMPGWHLHVLTAPNDSGKRFGGHLLNITADAGIEAQWMAADGLELTFPTGEAGRIYDALPLDQGLREITKAAEG